MPKLTDKKFSEVIDMTAEEFKGFLEECNPSLGETLSLKNLLNVVYDSINTNRELLITKYHNSDTSEEDKTEIDTVVAGIVKYMLSIEYKCCLLKERVDLLVSQTDI